MRCNRFKGVNGYIDGPFTSARFMYPYALALDFYHKVLVVGDSYNYATSVITNGKRVTTTRYFFSVRKLSLTYKNVTTIAGRSGCITKLPNEKYSIQSLQNAL